MRQAQQLIDRARTAGAILLLAFTLLCTWPEIAPVVAAGADVIYCYDPNRNVVTRSLAVDCGGVEVSEEQARKISDERSAYVQGVVRGRPLAPFGNAKMVSAGTGFFVTARGRLVTNNHVVSGCKGITVETAVPQMFVAATVAVDVSDDLALVDSKVGVPSIAKFRLPNELPAHLPVAVVGYGNQGLMPIEPDVVRGHVLELARSSNSNTPLRLAIEADVRQGSSGSPILDESGGVIGVIVAKLNIAKVYRETKTAANDVGYAIPALVVTSFLARNNTPYDVASPSSHLDASQILEISRTFVVRVGCWK